ncbi:hypothetical protein KBD71_01130 [Candidatus Woesebacteria bacterium]|nr:hypothetical protein [Candidatus Woesebacteria bacterium]
MSKGEIILNSSAYENHPIREGSIEAFVAHMDGSSPLLSYDRLPRQFSSQGLEQFLTRCQECPKPDDVNEVGGFILLDLNLRRLLYPQGLVSGHDEVDLEYPTNLPNSQTPIATVHTHPHDTCASVPDLMVATNGLQNNPHRVVPLNALSTPNYHYALIRTSETVRKDIFRFYDNQYCPQLEPHQVQAFLRGATPQAQQFSADARAFARLQNFIESNVYGGTSDMRELYRRFWQIFTVAKYLKLGYYVSTKNGNFQQFTENLMVIHSARIYQRAIDSAIRLNPSLHPHSRD